MILTNSTLNLLLGLLAFIVVGYLPISLFLYWYSKIRGGVGSQISLLRDRDIAGFFGQRPTFYWNIWAYIWPMLFATVVIIFGFLLAYPAGITFLTEAGLKGEASLSTITSVSDRLERASRPLFFGFLGAYLFTLQTTTRRFLAADLNPDTYLQIATRTILSILVAAVFSLSFPQTLTAGVLVGKDPSTLVLVLAFVVGIFPENGINWILSFARRYLPGQVDEIDTSYQLQKLSGLNRWHAIRLNVEGIDNVQNLANVEVLDLVRRTRFPVQQIFDWIDQAVLLIHLGSYEEFHRMQASGIRGLSDFQAAYHNSETRQGLEKILEKPNGLKGKVRLHLLYTTLQQTPSSDPIRLFWRYKSSYLTGAFEFFNRARVFAELGQHPLAIEQCNFALERNPLDPMLIITRGESRRAIAQEILLTGNRKGAEEYFQQAISDFTKAIELDIFSVEAYYNRGRTYFLTEKYTQSVADFERVLQIVNDDIATLNYRAQALQALGREEQSIRDLEKALRLDPNAPKTYVNLANAYRISGNFTKAEEYFEKAIQKNPILPAIYHGRGLLYATMSPKPRFEAAYEDFNRAIELGGPEPVVYKDWGETYYRQGNHSKAIATFDLAIDANKSYALAYNLRGLTYQAAAQPELAIENYTIIIDKINREYADAYINRGIAFSDQGNYADALNDLRRGIDLDPELIVAYLNRGRVYRRMQDYELARADFNTAIRLQEKKLEQSRKKSTDDLSATPYNNLGELDLEQAKYSEAEEHFTKALNINPHYAEAYNNRGLARRALGQHITARNDLSEAINLDPTSAVYYYNRGLLHLDLVAFDEAIRDFTQAIQRKPNYEEAHLRRAITYQQKSKIDLAIADVKKGLEINPNNTEAKHLYTQLTQASAS